MIGDRIEIQMFPVSKLLSVSQLSVHTGFYYRYVIFPEQQQQKMRHLRQNGAHRM